MRCTLTHTPPPAHASPSRPLVPTYATASHQTHSRLTLLPTCLLPLPLVQGGEGSSEIAAVLREHSSLLREILAELKTQNSH